jgi:periplasmic divalent cation tolerance protein
MTIGKASYMTKRRMDEVVFLYTTWPDAETADAAATQAVERRLAACANILAPMRAVYRWNGVVERANEIPAIFKTTARSAAELAELLKQMHPYDTPAIAALPVSEQGSYAPFLAWIGAETGRG